MIFAVFDVSVIACRRQQVYKLMFCTFIVNNTVVVPAFLYLIVFVHNHFKLPAWCCFTCLHFYSFACTNTT